MISSMTGYGQSEIQRDDVKLTAEIRSLNNRFLDVQVRMPKFLQPLEGRVRDTIGKAIGRGKINLVLTWESTGTEATRVSLDLDVAEAYRGLLNKLRDALGIEEDIRLEHLMNFSEIFKLEREEWDEAKAWTLLEEVLRVALENLQRMRRQEGEQLHKDMSARIAQLEEIVSEIERRYPQKVEQVRVQLREKIAALLDAPAVDEQRLAMEVALLAEKTDITEECVRFHSHNQLFLATLEEDGPVGRKLTFLLQEMNREANTMASKANDVQVAHHVVKIKEELERIREQAQNVE